MSKKNDDKTKDDKIQKTNSNQSKKQIRFAESDETFTSTHSFLEKEDEAKGNRPGSSNISVLKDFLGFAHFDYTKPPESTPCISDEGENIVTTSSHQLFVITEKSPVPSDPDLRLIAWTYLGKLDGVKDAIRRGANVNTLKEKKTPLLIATEIGAYQLVAYFLRNPDVNPDTPNTFGETPLLVAVRNAFGNIIKLLLRHNANVNKADNMGRTPLQIALFQKRPQLAKLLLAYGADYEKEDSFGEKPMYTSVIKRPDLKCVLILLRVGATPEYCNNSGISLLSRAIFQCSTFEIIRVLIRFGASVNSKDWYSHKTPLHFAALTNDVKVTNYLLAHGADPNRTTVYNFTPFDEAVLHKSLSVAEILLKHTKHPNVKLLKAIRLELGKNKTTDYTKSDKTKGRNKKKNLNLQLYTCTIIF